MRALIADDDPVTKAIVSASLGRWGIDVVSAADGRDAWSILTAGSAPDIAIVDWMMPGLDGVELCRRIRMTPALARMYVLLLTARGSKTDLIAGLDAGADDYMIKPIDVEELRARVRVGMRIANLQGKLAAQVTDLRGAQEHLATLVSTDVLTELYSRRRWFELAATEMSRSQRYGRDCCLMVLDLDHFKRINDTFGHGAGDRVLRRFADMLRAECRQSDVIGRLGGEEFGLIAPETAEGSAAQMAGRIRDACRRISVATPLGAAQCSCSIGITQVTANDDDIEAVLSRADAALYEAKRSGRDSWKVHALVRS